MKIILSSRRHHYMARLSIFLIMVALIAGIVGCGDNTPPPQTVRIEDWFGLNATRNDLGGNYILVKDLNADTPGYNETVNPEYTNGLGWEPIGTSDKRFTGNFDGQGHKIEGLFINRRYDDDVGLFGYVFGGHIKNVGVVNANVTGRERVGVLVGYNWEGTVESDTGDLAYSTNSAGRVTGNNSVGGLVGANYGGTVSLSESNVVVYGEPWRAGGLVGRNFGNVLNCRYNGSVTGDMQVGGLVGLNGGFVFNSDGSYIVTGNNVVGGVAGRNLGDLSDNDFDGPVIKRQNPLALAAPNEGTTSSSNASDTAPDGWYFGGLVGLNEGNVTNSSFSGSVIGDDYVGGLVGYNNGTVTDSYHNYDEVLINRQKMITLGALFNDDFEQWLAGDKSLNVNLSEEDGYYLIKVENSSVSGSVIGDSNVGGLVGYNDGTVTNSYYNYDKVLINEQKMITLGALFNDDFEKWLDGDKSLNVNLSEEDGYYLINDFDDFTKLLAFGQDDSLKFRLTSDLDLGTEPNFYIPYLAGEFDGNGHKISNLNLDSGFVSNVGLFGYLAGGKVSEVGVENVNITGFEFVGGLVGWNEEGTVSDSYYKGSVIGDSYVGGLVGYNNGTVNNSHSSANVTCKSSCGCLVGRQGVTGTMTNSDCTGTVNRSFCVG